MTPMDWLSITSIKFTSHRVDLGADIFPTTIRSLLGFTTLNRVFKDRSIRSGTLAVNAIQGALSQLFLADIRARNRLLRCLFLIILKGCFLGNNSSTINFSIIGVLRDMTSIRDYDWGSFTFSYFLYGMHLYSEG